MKGVFQQTLGAVCLILLTSVIAPCMAAARPVTAAAKPATAAAKPVTATASKSASPIASRQVGDEARGIVAGAVMVALTERLHDSVLRIRLKSVEVKSREGAAQNLEGVGEYHSARKKEWTSFRFSTRYVPADGSATYPALDLGQPAGTPLRVLNDPLLIGELETRVCDQIAKDSGVRDVRLQFDEIRSDRNPDGALDISADARVDVGIDTGRRTRIEGRYDEHARKWITVNYLFDIPDRLTGGR